MPLVNVSYGKYSYNARFLYKKLQPNLNDNILCKNDKFDFLRLQRLQQKNNFVFIIFTLFSAPLDYNVVNS